MASESNPKKIKHFSVMGIVLCMVLAWNTNRNPNVLIEQIFKPVHGGNWVFNYSGVLLVVAMYQLLKLYSKVAHTVWVKSAWRRILLVVVLFYMGMPINAALVKGYRGLSEGVSAIYLERGDMRLRIENEGDQEEGVRVSGQVTLQNCDNKESNFWIELSVPKYCQDLIVTDRIVLREPYTLQGHEKRTITFDQSFDTLKGWGTGQGTSSHFEMRLYDQQESVSFVRKFAHEWLDDERIYVTALEVLEIDQEVGGIAAVIHQPNEVQRDRIDRYLVENIYEAQNWEDQFLVVPYHGGSTVTLYEVNFDEEGLDEEHMLGVYEIEDDAEVVLLKVPVPCGMPTMKVVVHYAGQESEYIITYDGKGDRPQIETILLAK